jgi:cobalt-zinc-cadmium efflux system membrane fusion protein
MKRKDNMADNSVSNGSSSGPSATHRLPARNRALVIVSVALSLVVLLGILFWARSRHADPKETKASAPVERAEKGEAAEKDEIELSPEALARAGIETAAVTERQASALLRVTGTVEANQQQTQQVTPLVSGRVERVNVVLGDRVRAGASLAVISSPQIAEMRGKLREAQTRLALAEENYAHAQKAENRVGVLTAKSKLDEAEATLKRTQKLIELGAGAGKDLVAAQSEYQRAKAEYDFQSNISLNREVRAARAEVETARVEVSQLKSGLSALGAEVSDDEQGGQRAASLIVLRAPVSGMVSERLVNAGAGIEAGKPLFTVANISNVWVIANVPEAQVRLLRVGTPAEVRAAALGEAALAGRVSYIDPQLNQDTRTARVRVEVANRGEQLKVGMFAEVGFQTVVPGAGKATANELVIPEVAVQHLGERAVVFVPEEKEPGHFKVREVELGSASEGFRRIVSGLEAGDRVVTKGSFRLKAHLMKGELGEDKD